MGQRNRLLQEKMKMSTVHHCTQIFSFLQTKYSEFASSSQIFWVVRHLGLQNFLICDLTLLTMSLLQLGNYIFHIANSNTALHSTYQLMKELLPAEWLPIRMTVIFLRGASSWMPRFSAIFTSPANRKYGTRSVRYLSLGNVGYI